MMIIIIIIIIYEYGLFYISKSEYAVIVYV